MKLMNKIIPSAIAASLIVTLVGCGGGGGTTTTTPETPETPETPAAATSKAVWSTSAAVTPAGTVLSGDITQNTLLTKDKTWEISGLVKVRPGAVLTIEPGTTIASAAGANYLVVMKGATIVAAGTEAEPITFTSKTGDDSIDVANRGLWGGLTILGNAPTNHTDPVYEVDESDPDFAFGGTDAFDNSGILTHVNILNSGFEVATDVEINGLSLCGVGAGTVINHIVANNSSDDAIEIWGGTVNLSHVTIKNSGDDSLDMDYGYIGTVSDVEIVQNSDSHAGTEISSGGSNPMTAPTLYNFSITTVDGADEGGIYIKDDTTAPTFINGTVTVNGTNAGGGIKTKAVFTDAQKAAMSFTEVTINEGTNDLATGAGATDAETEYNNQATITTPTGTVLAGNIEQNTLLTNDRTWEISGLVKVKPGYVLAIEPGTTIASAAGANYMVVMQGAKIFAAGTKAEPITFTSKTGDDSIDVANRGLWGGLTILGNAPTNHTDPVYEVDESDTDFTFGGTDKIDNSGILTYVNILNSGFEVATDVEINGLSLCGVGAGTTINNIDANNSSDDAIEIWGGTVNLSDVTIANSGDDSLDMDYGYIGTVSDVEIVQNSDSHAGSEISSGGMYPMTSPILYDFSITTVDGADEGGLYIKDDTTAPTFINGTVTVNGTNAGGGIKTKAIFTDEQNSTMAFSNVTIDAGTNDLATGAGATDATALYNDQ